MQDILAARLHGAAFPAVPRFNTKNPHGPIRPGVDDFERKVTGLFSFTFFSLPISTLQETKYLPCGFFPHSDPRP